MSFEPPNSEPPQCAPASQAVFPPSVVEIAVRLGLLGGLAYWTIALVHPFMPIMLWSVVLAVALYPVFAWLSQHLGGRRGLAAALLTLVGLLVVIGPVTWMGVGLVEAGKEMIGQLEAGTLSIPAPPRSLADWPLIGQPLFEFWTSAMTNMRGALTNLAPQLKPLGEFLLGAARSASAGTLEFIASVIIAGFLFAPGPRMVATMRTLARRVDPADGDKFLALAEATIHAVSRGVIGVALLEAIVAGLAMSFAHVPGAALLTLAILVLGIVQISPLIVAAPVIFWAWTNLSAIAALALTIAMLAVYFIGEGLKPFLLSRGLSTPMLVVFIGVIGGVLANGVVGLFTGPVVLAVAWELARAWIAEPPAMRGPADFEPGGA